MKASLFQSPALLRTLAGYGLATLALVCTLKILGSYRETFAIAFEQTTGPSLALASLFFAIHTLINREAFVGLGRALRLDITKATLRRIWNRSLLAKYIPGGVWQIFGRAILLKAQGIGHPRALVMGLVEQAISLCACSVFALIPLLGTHRGTPAVIGLALLAVLSAAALTFARNQPVAADRSALVQAVALYTSAMPFYLLGYWTLASNAPLQALCTQLFAGTIVGMLAFFVPGGIGIRESAAALLGQGGMPGLLGSMVIGRILTIAIESSLTLAGMMAGHLTARDRANRPKKAANGRPRLIVAGAALSGSGYPNAWNTVELLRQTDDIKIIDCAYWLPDDFHLWRLAKGPTPTKLAGLTRLVLGNLFSLARALRHLRRECWIYIPYPSLPILWICSWVPAALRPNIACDSYITLWDSLYKDRVLGNGHSALSKALRRAEGRALRAANAVIVDTEANADFVASFYNVRRRNIHAFPLAISEMPVKTRQQAQDVLRILFVGTFVPLQGVGVIAGAMNLLRESAALEFIIVGDGQQAEDVADTIAAAPNATWIRQWQSQEQLAEHMYNADICLGIFGGDGKASRVLPFKVYSALAYGKAIISQRMYSLPDGTPALPAYTIEPTAQALATAICTLAAEPQRRLALAQEAQAYYSRHLGPARLQQCWGTLLKG